MLYTGVVLFVSQGKAHIFSRIAVSRIFAATNKSTTPDNADMVCTRSILGDTVNAPKIPATQTHQQKTAGNSAMPEQINNS